MKEFAIKYTSPHGRQEERPFEVTTTRIELRTRAALSIDITSLDQCRELETLDLSNNLLDSLDLAPLSNHSKLRLLFLQDNRLSELNLWPLAKCNGLEEINLLNNRLRTLDITPVFDLRELRINSSVVLAADYMLKHILPPRVIQNRFRSVRSEHPFRLAMPIVIWNSYSELLRRHGWKSVYIRIRQTLDRVPPELWFHAQKGMLEGLGMSELAGYDGDPRRLIEGVNEHQDVEPALDMIYDTALELLSEQFQQGGPTLFLDTGAMRNTRASRLIPTILDRRKREMEDITVPILDGRAHLQSLWLSSYGFDVLTALKTGLTTDTWGLDRVKVAMEEMGCNLRAERVDTLDIGYSKIVSESFRRFVFSCAGE
ncbi:MAG: hypothetical protein ACE5H4_15195 [Candidatus Thorarchaeota archaeon]